MHQAGSVAVTAILSEFSKCLTEIFDEILLVLFFTLENSCSGLPMSRFQCRQCPSHVDVWLLLSNGCKHRAVLLSSAGQSSHCDGTGQKVGCGLDMLALVSLVWNWTVGFFLSLSLFFVVAIVVLLLLLLLFVVVVVVFNL